jgi:hypothetical protein
MKKWYDKVRDYQVLMCYIVFIKTYIIPTLGKKTITFTRRC